MPEEFEITAARKITQLERQMEKIKAGMGGHQIAPVAGITRYVGPGRDFTTIQAAINWYKGMQFGDLPCNIYIDAGTYAENVVVSHLDTKNLYSLQLVGDQRQGVGYSFISGWANAGNWTAGAAYVPGNTVRAVNVAGRGKFLVCIVGGNAAGAEPAWGAPGTAQVDGTVTWLIQGYALNSFGTANMGSGWCELTNAGNTITCVGVTNPNFTNLGIVANDQVMVRDSAGACTVMTVQSVLNNTITFTAPCPAVGQAGSAMCILPNVIITGSIAVYTSHLSLYGMGFLVTSSAGAAGVLVSEYGTVTLSYGCAFWDDAGTSQGNLGINVTNGSRLFCFHQSVSLMNLTYGIGVNVGSSALIYYLRVIKTWAIGIYLRTSAELVAQSCYFSAYPANGQCVDGGAACTLYLGSCDLAAAYFGVVCATSIVWLEACRLYLETIGIYNPAGFIYCNNSSFSNITSGVQALNGGQIRATLTSTLMAAVVTPYTPAVTLTPDATGAMVWWT